MGDWRYRYPMHEKKCPRNKEGTKNQGNRVKNHVTNAL
jgi:hypothetical protein